MAAPLSEPSAELVLTDEQEQPVRAARSRCCCRRPPAAARPRCSSSASCGAVREDGLAPGADPRDHVHRARRRRAARARARAAAGARRARGRARHRGGVVGTFHGFCARLLRAHPLAAGLDPGFAILDEGLAGRLRERAFQAALREFLDGERAEAVDLVAAYGVDRVQAMIEGGPRPAAQPRAARARALPRAAPARGAGRRATTATRWPPARCWTSCWRASRDAYERSSASARRSTSTTSSCCARELLEGHEEHARGLVGALRAADGGRVPGHQPAASSRSCRRSSASNLFTVGDEFQSIYGFRHAEVALFRDRRAALAELGGASR